MRSLAQHLSESVKTPAGGIQHISHPSDTTFRGEEATKNAIDTLRGSATGSAPISRKIDDKMSYQVIRDKAGKVGVKYKGPGSHYNYSNDDIDTQHGHKPYLADPLKKLLEHLPKVLPKRAGEYQGGYMSSPSDRKVVDGRISHQPNTIEYSVSTDTEEGKKLKNSKLSTVIHSELKGPNREASPINDTSEFRNNPDVHLVNHLVTHEEQQSVDPVVKRQTLGHLDQAEKIAKTHTYDHLPGHEKTLETYINSTVRNNEKPSVEGYVGHLNKHHKKLFDSVKTPKAKEAKNAAHFASVSHVNKNKKAFDKSLQMHGHVQAATNLLARGLGKVAHGGYGHAIDGQSSGPEGFVSNGLKVVDRGESGFSRANLARSAILKASPKLAKKV